MARTSQRQYSQDLHRRVIKKWTAGMSERKIGHLDMPRVSVQTIIRFEKKHDHVNLKPRPGRPRCTDLRHDRRIVREVEKNRFVTGLNGRSARKKPYLNPKHRRKRFAYAKKFKNQTAGFWKRVLFTDEASVELHGTSGRVSVWRRPHGAFDAKCIKATFKSSRKSLMVWGSMTADGVGTLHFCDESVTGDYYRRLLRQNVPITKQFLGLAGETLFVQDNAPAHSAKLTADCLRDLKLITLGHPPQSPDLNPIENL
ncbi:hypothetical protein PC114_g5232 [Phytophthora cactorum]|nr:hypothetical protein PC112_g3767 [Phytophthora cactorum]KAG2922496.1 hypothetical protein PC114_g5232 [Phytophthora cactorum]KAG3016734.1 hypothetical protein PC120_g11454 [Phytophthora cactorum]KAG3104339.1 hypothetical protein PC121_g767 [Phytophthora cactorum]KAG3184801.1 hypothetical protein C6341_g4778 [Phytophthora cactorum]